LPEPTQIIRLTPAARARSEHGWEVLPESVPVEMAVRVNHGGGDTKPYPQKCRFQIVATRTRSIERIPCCRS
jgi:hypothetical protein